jgi:hypothetical protein
MVKESVMKGLEEMFQTNATRVVKMLSVKYGFDLGEALADLAITETVKVVKGKQAKQGKEEDKEEGEQAKQGQAKQVKKEKKEKKEKREKMAVPKMVLPYCGRVVEEWCEGVKKNHGLYSQCTGEKNGEGKYCKACKKQAEANDSGKPTLGNINERMEGPKRVPYAVVLKKLKIEKEEACAEAKKFGLEIPLEEFEMPVSSRGRPKKVSESESVSSDEGEKKRRGRPKKNKTVAANTTDETDDLIASLVAEANALKSASACETEADASACETEAEDAEVDDSACERDACETDADSEAEAEVDEILLKKIHEKINADKTFKKMSKMVVEKKERKKHLLAVGEYIKTLLTEEELALYNGPPEEADIYGSEDEEEAEDEAEEEVEASEPVEDEATRKAREAAEKKAQVELEKQQKKEQADQEKKAKAEEKAREAAEKKAQVELEKQQQAKQKKEQAEQEKKAKQQAAAEKKAQAELEKQQAKPAEAKEKKVAKKKEAKPAEVKPVEAKPAEAKPAEKKEKKAKEEKKPAEVKPAEVKPVEKKVEEELLAEAVAEEAVAEEAPEEAVAEETVTAKVFEYEGKKYLKTEEGILYDQATEECVGVWNEETKSIDEFADEED